MATRSTKFLKRSLVIDATRGRVRILEFHVVWHSLGMMLETRSISPFLAKNAIFDPDEEANYIDDIQFIDGRERYLIQNPLNYGTTRWACLHDLQLGPRIQDYTEYGKHTGGPRGA